MVFFMPKYSVVWLCPNENIPQGSVLGGVSVSVGGGQRKPNTGAEVVPSPVVLR